MNADAAAITALCCYAAVAVAAVVWQMLHCPAGPMIWWLYVLERLACGLAWHVRGQTPDGRSMRCPFPTGSGALIVANHRSPVDPIVLWHGHHLADNHRRIRPIGFLMAREFYDDRRLTWFYRAMTSIPVNRDGRDMTAVRQAIARLKAGDLVGIFPEGGINHGPPGVKSANPGVAFLALSAGVPVYPVYIADAPVGSTLVRSVLRSARVRPIYGEPIDLSGYRGRKKSQDLLNDVTDRILDAVASLGGVGYAGTATDGAATPPVAVKTENAPVSNGLPHDAERRPREVRLQNAPPKW